MGEVTVRSTLHEFSAWHDEYSRVPIPSEREYRPVPKRLDEQERRKRQGPPRRNLWPTQKSLDERRDQPESMKPHQHRIVTSPPLDSPPGPQPPLIPPRVE